MKVLALTAALMLSMSSFACDGTKTKTDEEQKPEIQTRQFQ